jgi:hypothetical protein
MMNDKDDKDRIYKNNRIKNKYKFHRNINNDRINMNYLRVNEDSKSFEADRSHNWY